MRAQRFDDSGIAIGDPDELGLGDRTLGGIAVDPATVPLRGVPGSYKPSRLKLQSRADDYEARRDKDTLGLECLPGKEAADPPHA